MGTTTAATTIPEITGTIRIVRTNTAKSGVAKIAGGMNGVSMSGGNGLNVTIVATTTRRTITMARLRITRPALTALISRVILPHSQKSGRLIERLFNPLAPAAV